MEAVKALLNKGADVTIFSRRVSNYYIICFNNHVNFYYSVGELV